MNNPYFEKAASLYSFLHDFSGKDYSDLKARKHHLERAIAHGDTVEGLSAKINDAGKRTFRARGIVGAGAVGAAALGVAGSHAYSTHQNEKARKNMMKILALQKQASFRRSGFSKMVRRSKSVVANAMQVAKDVGSATLDVVNTAHGGKIKQLGMDTFGGYKTKDFKKFSTASTQTQRKMLYRKGGAEALSKFKDLQRKQRVARVGVYGTIGGAGLAYSKGKASARQEMYQQGYY